MKSYKKLNIKGKIVLVDEEDIPKLGKRKWYISQRGYASRNTTVNWKRFRETMHRLIMDAPEGLQVDHINGNKLDNRKSNLRLCERYQNMANKPPTSQNKSGYKGVYYDNRDCFMIKRWVAKIRVNKKDIHIGMYKTAKEAVVAWNKKAKELLGEFAYQNKYE